MLEELLSLEQYCGCKLEEIDVLLLLAQLEEELLLHSLLQLEEIQLKLED